LSAAAKISLKFKATFQLTTLSTSHFERAEKLKLLMFGHFQVAKSFAFIRPANAKRKSRDRRTLLKSINEQPLGSLIDCRASSRSNHFDWLRMSQRFSGSL